VVVVMLWLFLTAYAIVLGAELNAESERQTARDTTTGPARPLGTRHAEAADTVGPTADEVKAGVPADADVTTERRPSSHVG
jgi:membrane protein